MKPCLFLIHGWNMHAGIWKKLLAHLQGDFEIQCAALPGYPSIDSELSSAPHFDDCSASDLMDQMIECLLEQAPAEAHWCGWSLGATLAMEAAMRHPERISELTLISPTPRFLKNENPGDAWPWGMEEKTFSKLARVTLKNYDIGWSKFLNWQLPNGHAPELLDELKSELAGPKPLPHALDHGRRILCDTDLRGRLAEITQPSRIVYAYQDEIIPPKASHFVASQIPNATFQVIGNCHALAWLSADKLAEALKQPTSVFDAILNNQPTTSPDKNLVAQRFSNSAKQYDQLAKVQAEMADDLIAMLGDDATGNLIDLGCGTGATLRRLSESHAFQLTGIDLAAGMIEYAKKHYPVAEYFCEDLEQTSLPDQAADVVFSNAAVQWCDLEKTIKECHRLLKPQGRLLLSTFGPWTLSEWRSVLRKIDPERQHVHRFLSAGKISDVFLSQSKWCNLHVGGERKVCMFDTVDEMLNSIRRLGASFAGSQNGGISKTQYRQLRELLEASRNKVSKLELTYDCIYVTGEKC